MNENFNLNELVEKLTATMPDSINTFKSDVKNNIKTALETGLREMNLVSREEFDVQTALLARTLEQLKTLEKQVDELSR